jgi:hypothetical protein
VTRYAQDTVVSVEKSRAEIERLITRYGATQTAFMNAPGRALIMFEAKERRIVFELPLPDINEDRFKLGGWNKCRPPEKQHQVWEQACRQCWRALALVIKAKLEAVESGITTFEDEFLAHIVMPDGLTVGAHVKPTIAAWYAGGTMRPLLPAPKGKQ